MKREMSQKQKIVLGPPINITGSMRPAEIVKTVVNTFIDFEKDKKGKGVIFKYPVEDLSIGGSLYIIRPGKKWNFDFKVDLKQEYLLERGTHDQIALILRKIKNKNRDEFNKLWSSLINLYDCIECDVEKLLKDNPIVLEDSPQPDIFLKVIKWLFIMEDILYWHFEGRAFLYNFFLYSVSEVNDDNFKTAITKLKNRRLKPEQLKSLLKALNLAWRIPENY